jgi:hypothetical protein
MCLQRTSGNHHHATRYSLPRICLVEPLDSAGRSESGLQLKSLSSIPVRPGVLTQKSHWQLDRLKLYN